MKKKAVSGQKHVYILIGIVTILVLILRTGILDQAENSAADWLYQKRQAASGIISLIGIDDRSMEEYGPYQSWKRDVITALIRTLNVSEEIRPAVIGIDIIYSGESEPKLDNALAEAAGEYGNVVVASVAEFGTQLLTQPDGNRKLMTDTVVNYIYPYEALARNAKIGNINAMLDSDGIFRHHLLQVPLPDGTIVPSLAAVIAKEYAASVGSEPPLMPKTDGRGYWYVPFTGKPGDYDEGISVAAILDGEIPPEYFAGRIVLIGPYSVGLQDQYIASMDHAEPFFGVEIQANIVEALLRGIYLYELDDTIQCLIVWLFLMVCGLVFLRKIIWLSTSVWICGSGIWYLLCGQMAAGGTLLHVLWLPVMMTVLYVGFIAYSAYSSMKEKRQITNMFSHYVAPEIVKELIRLGPEGLQLGGRVARVAVLFVDVRGFTSMSEVLEPTEVVAILNEYLSLITECILKNQGTLDKFVGDAAMAVWGSPLPQEDCVMHAVQAGIDMVRGSEALSVRLQEKYGRTVAFGIGVNTGEAVVGNMGSAIHMDYTAIGDTVNTAARLEANAPGGHVYISRAVADELGDRMEYHSLGSSICLKGKAEGFEVLDLVIPEL